MVINPKNDHARILQLHREQAPKADPTRTLEAYNTLRLRYWSTLAEMCVYASDHYPGSPDEKATHIAMQMKAITG